MAAGGVVYLLEDDRKGEEIVNEEVLSARIGHRVTPVRDADLFEAALVSAGRLGVIWAYVIEVHDETGVAIIETRDVSRWDVVRETLVADARGAATADEFLQVVVEPIGGEPYKAYVTRHSMKAGNPTDEAADPPLTHVARAREQSGAALAFQMLLTPRGLELLSTLVTRLPASLNPAVHARIVARLAEIGTTRPNGTTYIAGDAVADMLNDLTELDRGWVVLKALADVLVANEQRDYIWHPGARWEVKGTRFEIADFYNYEADDGYRGESIGSSSLSMMGLSTRLKRYSTSSANSSGRTFRWRLTSRCVSWPRPERRWAWRGGRSAARSRWRPCAARPEQNP